MHYKHTYISLVVVVVVVAAAAAAIVVCPFTPQRGIGPL
jgi:hypothetical protein